MLQDVINELDLSESAIEEHGPLETPPAKLVRMVLDQKDAQIRILKQRPDKIRKLQIALWLQLSSNMGRVTNVSWNLASSVLSRGSVEYGGLGRPVFSSNNNRSLRDWRSPS